MRKVEEAVWTILLPRTPVFTTRRAAETAGVRLDVASRALRKLANRGAITRIMRGVWADTKHPDFSPYAVVPYLVRDVDSNDTAYVSLLSALSLHGMIEQIPRVIQVIVGKQRPAVRTRVGLYEFHQLQANLLGGFVPYRQTGNFDIATPAKALFDTLYLSARRGRRFSRLPELTLVTGFSEAELEEWIHRIDLQRLRLGVARRWQQVRAESGPVLTHVIR